MLKKLLLSAGLLLGFSAPSFAQLAVLLPPGEQQFTDGNGAPLAGGSVGFYIPSTLTPKTTWADPTQSGANANPVPLDASGRAIIFGSGQYREIVKDAFGNTIWDQLTYGQGPFPVYGGSAGGTGNAITISAGNWVQQGGEQIAFRATANNTGATTLTIGSTTYSVLKNSSAGPIPLTGGEITTGNIITGLFDTVTGDIIITQTQGFTGAGGTRTSINSATTTDLGTIGSHNVNIVAVGSPITSFGSSAAATSPFYFVHFAGSVTLQQSANLLLPGQGPIITGSGDELLAEYIGGGAWQVLSYWPQSGPAISSFTQGQISLTNSTTITLFPYQGNDWTLANGTTATIPSAGISSSATNAFVNGVSGQTLTANALWYAYLWNSGTLQAPVWVVDWSATGHSTDANTGIEIKTGDNTRALIGMAYLATGPLFQDQGNWHGVANWANRIPKQISGSFTANRTTTSNSLVEINTEIRTEFLNWKNNAVDAQFTGLTSNSGANSVFSGISIDGSTATGNYFGQAAAASSSNGANASVSGSFLPSEGAHYLTVFGAVSGGTGTWNWNTTGQTGEGIISGSVLE